MNQVLAVLVTGHWNRPFKKVGYYQTLFLCFRLFDTVDSKQIFDIIFADDWIQTTDLWYQKRPLFQLSHNHCHVEYPFLDRI